jgi:hypothetical protein
MPEVLGGEKKEPLARNSVKSSNFASARFLQPDYSAYASLDDLVNAAQSFAAVLSVRSPRETG